MERIISFHVRFSCVILRMILTSGVAVALDAGQSALGGELAVPEETATLLKSIERNSGNYVARDQQGHVYRLLVPFGYVTDNNLRLVSACPFLTDLSLRFTKRDYRSLTGEGLKRLKLLPHLERLKVGCPGSLPNDFFVSLCELTNLTSLTLELADPPRSSYSLLTNLIELEVLVIGRGTNFTDAALEQLSVLPNLKSIGLYETRVTDQWLGIIRQFRSLTNAIVSQYQPETPSKMETLSWSRQN
jgi:hypothetical protein